MAEIYRKEFIAEVYDSFSVVNVAGYLRDWEMATINEKEGERVLCVADYLITHLSLSNIHATSVWSGSPLQIHTWSALWTAGRWEFAFNVIVFPTNILLFQLATPAYLDNGLYEEENWM